MKNHKSKNEDEYFGAHVPLDLLSDIIGCEVPPHDRDPYGDFDTDAEAAEFGELKERVLESINWVFEKIPYAYNFEDFWIKFERGRYGNEPEDDKEYAKWLCEVIINKSGELTDEQCKSIRKLKFKKMSNEDLRYADKVMDENQTIDDLDYYFENTRNDRHWMRDSQEGNK